MGTRGDSSIKLVPRGAGASKKNVDKATISALDNSLLDIDSYDLAPAERFEWDREMLLRAYGEDEIDRMSPLLLDLEEDEAGVLLQLMSSGERRVKSEWYADLKKANFHFSDAPNNPFNKKHPWTVQELLKIGMLDEIREDSYGNTHYKVNKHAKGLLETWNKLGDTTYFPLEEDTAKEDFYYHGEQWENLLADITRERYRFPLPSGGFATYQSKSEENVFQYTKFSGGRGLREIPKKPVPFTYRLPDPRFSRSDGNYLDAMHDFEDVDRTLRDAPIDYPEFYDNFVKDWAGYEFAQSSIQKPAKTYKPEGYTEPMVDEAGMRKNMEFTGRAMEQHLSQVLSGDFEATELFPRGGEWYQGAYAWFDDGTTITLGSIASPDGTPDQLVVPFNRFAKFYDRRSKLRFVNLRSEGIDEDGESEERHQLAVFDGDRMAGLIPISKYGFRPSLSDSLVDYYVSKYPKLGETVASIFGDGRSSKTRKLG